MSRATASIAVTLSLAASCHAGAPACPSYSVSLLEGYRAIGDPALLPAQPAGALWRFRSGSPTGPLLQSISDGSITNAFGHWGDPTQPYTVPTGGPIYSNIPAENQVPFYRRDPSFTGVFLHPGFDDAHDSVSTFESPGTLFLTGLSLIAEDLGFFNGGFVSAGIIIGGVSTTLIAPTFVAPAPAASISLSASSGLPVFMHAGDIAWVRTNRNGDASEDWISVNMTLTLEGGPIILAPPLARTACPGASWKADITARGGTTYRWRKGTTDIFDGPTGTGSTISGAATSSLLITGVALADIASYSCRVNGACGIVTSLGVTPTLRCPGDADPNGMIEFADITAVLANFGSTYSSTIAGRGDADCSGTVDFADITRVLSLFGVPCP